MYYMLKYTNNGLVCETVVTHHCITMLAKGARLEAAWIMIPVGDDQITKTVMQEFFPEMLPGYWNTRFVVRFVRHWERLLQALRTCEKQNRLAEVLEEMVSEWDSLYSYFESQGVTPK